MQNIIYKIEEQWTMKGAAVRQTPNTFTFDPLTWSTCRMWSPWTSHWSPTRRGRTASRPRTPARPRSQGARGDHSQPDVTNVSRMCHERIIVDKTSKLFSSALMSTGCSWLMFLKDAELQRSGRFTERKFTKLEYFIYNWCNISIKKS